MGVTEGRPWLPPVIVVAIGLILFLLGAPLRHPDPQHPELAEPLVFAIWNWVPPWVWNLLVLLLGVFLILLVLIQRGKGGGLAGAFGGVGGSSAFGSRAGDMFTYITITVATAWLFLIMFQTISIQEAKIADAKRREAGASGIGVAGGQ